MTTFGHAHGHGTSGGGLSAAARAVGRCADAIRRRMEVARCERRLRALPDNMLKDMGLHRSEIPAVVRFGRMEYGG